MPRKRKKLNSGDVVLISFLGMKRKAEVLDFKYDDESNLYKVRMGDGTIVPRITWEGDLPKKNQKWWHIIELIK